MELTKTVLVLLSTISSDLAEVNPQFSCSHFQRLCSLFSNWPLPVSVSLPSLVSSNASRDLSRLQSAAGPPAPQLNELTVAKATTNYHLFIQWDSVLDLPVRETMQSGWKPKTRSRIWTELDWTSCLLSLRCSKCGTLPPESCLFSLICCTSSFMGE